MTKRKKPVEKEEPVEEVVENASLTSENEDGENVVDLLYKLVFENTPPASEEKVKISSALSTLRMSEMTKDNGIERSFYSAVGGCREKIIKLIMTEVLNNNLRLIDCGIIMSYVSRDMATMSVWEYENLEVADTFFGELEKEPISYKNNNMMDIFNALGEEDD